MDQDKIDKIEQCPQCKYLKALHTLYCKEFKEETLCPICGYKWTVEYDETTGDELISNEENGCGAIQYGKKGISKLITFRKPFKDEKKLIRNFNRFLRKNKLSGYLTKWDTEKEKVIFLVRNTVN